MDQLPRLEKRELICLLLFTYNYVVSVWRGFLFLWVLRMGYVILLWHSLSLLYNYFGLNYFSREQNHVFSKMDLYQTFFSWNGGVDKVTPSPHIYLSYVLKF